MTVESHIPIHQWLPRSCGFKTPGKRGMTFQSTIRSESWNGREDWGAWLCSMVQNRACFPHNTTKDPPDMFPFSCFFRCLSRLVCWPKHLSHKWHLNGFSLLWMLRTCRCRLEEMLKERSQYLHLESKYTHSIANTLGDISQGLWTWKLKSHFT